MPPKPPDPAPRAVRLSLAMDAGLVLPETGPIAIFRPRAGEDLSPLPKARALVVQGFRPDHDAFARAGWQATTLASGRFAAAMVCLPRARAEARHLIAEATALSDGPVLVDGQKHDGIDSILRDCRKRTTVSEPVSKGHGKLFWFTAPADTFADWTAVPRRLEEADANGFITLPGVFSSDGVDPASRLLSQSLPATLPARIADLGAGWGYLSAQVLARDGVQELHLIEAEATAVDCARANISDPRARFHWADALEFTPEADFDAVVMNPPFHAGRAGQPALGVGFIRAAANMLKGHGTLWLVANRHLPYEAALSECFRETVEISGNSGFKVVRASQPVVRQKRSRRRV